MSHLARVTLVVFGPLFVFAFGFTAGCETPVGPPPTVQSLPPRTAGLAVVVGMRGESGVLGLLSPQSLKVTPRVAPVSNDAVIRSFLVGETRYLFVLNRLSHDNVQVLRADDFRLVKQYSTGNGSNPQDLVVVSPTIAYISLLRRPYLLKVNPLTGKELGKLPLERFAEVGETACTSKEACGGKPCLGGLCARDGLPEATRLLLHGDHLWITLQQLDRTKVFAPRNPGKLVVFDTKTEQVVKTITLAGKNPTQLLEPSDGKTLWVVQTGRWFADDDKPVLDGVVEAIDLVTMKSRGVLFRETTLGGNLSSLALDREGKVFGILTGANRQTRLVEISTRNGEVSRTLASSRCLETSACYGFFAMKIHPGGRLFLADRDPKRPGVRVFSTETGNELTKQPLDIGLPPMSLLFLPGGGTLPLEKTREPSKDGGVEPAQEGGLVPDAGNVDGGSAETVPEPGERWRESRIEPWPDWNPDAFSPDAGGGRAGAGFVQKVVSFKPGPNATFGHDTFPANILGPPKGKGHFAGSFDVVSLGCGGELTLEFSNPVIVDGPGVDFVIFENAFTLGSAGDETFSEPAVVSVSPNGKRWYSFPCVLKNASWPYPGCAGTASVHSHPDNKISPYDVKRAGGNGYDLKTLGLRAVRFVRIRDRSNELSTSSLECSQTKAGFDLDAISVIWGASLP